MSVLIYNVTDILCIRYNYVLKELSLREHEAF